MTKQESMRAKSDQELSTLLSALRGELYALRGEAAGARPKDSNAPRKTRHRIARILTEQRARRAGSQHAAPALQV